LAGVISFILGGIYYQPDGIKRFSYVQAVCHVWSTSEYETIHYIAHYSQVFHYSAMWTVHHGEYNTTEATIKDLNDYRFRSDAEKKPLNIK
jgi:hypothetical protein